MTDFWATAIGRSATLTRLFTIDDLTTYWQLTNHPSLGNRDPVAGDELPPTLLAGVFSALLGTELPGEGSLYLNQKLAFSQPARVGDTVIARVTVTETVPEKHLVTLQTTASIDDQILCDGHALVMARQYPYPS